MDPIARLTALQAQLTALHVEARTLLDELARSFDGPPQPMTPSAPALAVSGAKGPRSKAKTRRKVTRSPSGPLAPAVAKVLTEAGRPLRVDEIFQALTAANYIFTGDQPKKSLAVRVYQLAGVKSLGGGLFGPA